MLCELLFISMGHLSMSCELHPTCHVEDEHFLSFASVTSQTGRGNVSRVASRHG
jgi:hypothetical protein